MVTFYNILKNTKVINREGSSAVKKADGSLDLTNCKTVIQYLVDQNKLSTLQIASNVDVTKPAAYGSWTNGKLVGGAVSYNVIQTMNDYPELLGNTWMAQCEEGDKIMVYWHRGSIDDLAVGQTVEAYKYDNSTKSYYVGTLTIEQTTQFGATYKRLVKPEGFNQPVEMPETMTIKGYYRYKENGQNWAKDTGVIRAFAYSDYQLDGITRWTGQQFTDEVGERKVFLSMAAATETHPYIGSGRYPYSTLPGVGSGISDSQYAHWGIW